MAEQKDNKFCVYGHYTADTNELFYVGKGTEFRSRQFGKTNRNNYWIKVANAHGVRVEIFARDLLEHEAFDKEIEIIAKYNPRCNFTKGGDGPTGVHRSAETRQKLSDVQKGKLLDEEHKKRIGEGLKQAYKDGRRSSLLGTTLDQERREKISVGQGMKPFQVYNRATGDFVGEWNNLHECARSLNLYPTGISLCLKGKRKSCKGFIFKRSI